MTKEELIGLTLDKLLEHFKESPESFEYHGPDVKPSKECHQTIFWQPKVQLGDSVSTIIPDPNNSHAVVLIFHDMCSEFVCHLFLKAPENLVTYPTAMAADSTVISNRFLEKWRGNYRKFKKLKKLIIARDRLRENMSFFRKLTSVFPNTMDDKLF